MEENWRSVCAWASGIYMLLIFGGQTYMANRSERIQKNEKKIHKKISFIGLVAEM